MEILWFLEIYSILNGISIIISRSISYILYICGILSKRKINNDYYWLLCHTNKDLKEICVTICYNTEIYVKYMSNTNN